MDSFDLRTSTHRDLEEPLHVKPGCWVQQSNPRFMVLVPWPHVYRTHTKLELANQDVVRERVVIKTFDLDHAGLELLRCDAV